MTNRDDDIEGAFANGLVKLLAELYFRSTDWAPVVTAAGFRHQEIVPSGIGLTSTTAWTKMVKESIQLRPGGLQALANVVAQNNPGGRDRVQYLMEAYHHGCLLSQLTFLLNGAAEPKLSRSFGVATQALPASVALGAPTLPAARRYLSALLDVPGDDGCAALAVFLDHCDLSAEATRPLLARHMKHRGVDPTQLEDRILLYTSGQPKSQPVIAVILASSAFSHDDNGPFAYDVSILLGLPGPVWDRMSLDGASLMQVRDWIRTNLHMALDAVENRTGESVMIEFYLPWQLMDEPVDEWDVLDAYNMEEPIGKTHITVVRNYERMRLRADKVDVNMNKRIQARPPTVLRLEHDQDQDNLYSTFLYNGTAAILLCECALHRRGEQFWKSVTRAGLPYGLWARINADAQPVIVKRELEALLGPCEPSHLPEAVRTYRVEVAARKRTPICAGIGLLYENPAVMPRLAEQPAKNVG